jgi:DNA-binding MarR family transcriptional regulator
MTPTPDPLDQLQADLGWALGATLRAYSKTGGPILAGIPGGHRGYQLLAAASGAEHTQLALATRLGVDRTVMTYLLDDLEKAGLVERKPDPADRRARRIVVTEAGRTTMRELQGKLAHAEADVLSALTPPERALFRDLLRTVATHVGLHEPQVDACTAAESCTDAAPGAGARRRKG